jgi:hypothetical protein
MLTDSEERSYLDGEHSVVIRRRLISISCCRQVYERAVERFVEHDHERGPADVHSQDVREGAPDRMTVQFEGRRQGLQPGTETQASDKDDGISFMQSYRADSDSPNVTDGSRTTQCDEVCCNAISAGGLGIRAVTQNEFSLSRLTEC